MMAAWRTSVPLRGALGAARRQIFALPAPGTPLGRNASLSLLQSGVAPQSVARRCSPLQLRGLATRTWSVRPVPSSLLRAAVQRLPRRWASQASEAQINLAAWNLRMALENGWLSWTRNGVISTVAAAALVPMVPLASAGLLMFGLGFMGVGTMHYLYYGAKLRGPLGLGRAAFAWVIVTSLTGFATWTASVYMLLHKDSEHLDKIMHNLLVVLRLQEPSIAEMTSSRATELLTVLALDIEDELEDLVSQQQTLGQWLLHLLPAAIRPTSGAEVEIAHHRNVLKRLDELRDGELQTEDVAFLLDLARTRHDALENMLAGRLGAELGGSSVPGLVGRAAAGAGALVGSRTKSRVASAARRHREYERLLPPRKHHSS